MERYRDPATAQLFRFSVRDVRWTTLRCDETTGLRPKWTETVVSPEQASRLIRVPEDVAPRYEAEARSGFANR